eukprot:scaffold56066_cov16-Tisochrysis_lutea.AAC.2
MFNLYLHSRTSNSKDISLLSNNPRTPSAPPMLTFNGRREGSGETECEICPEIFRNGVWFAEPKQPHLSPIDCTRAGMQPSLNLLYGQTASQNGLVTLSAQPRCHRTLFIGSDNSHALLYAQAQALQH